MCNLRTIRILLYFLLLHTVLPVRLNTAEEDYFVIHLLLHINVLTSWHNFPFWDRLVSIVVSMIVCVSFTP